MPRKRNQDFIRLVGERLRSLRLSAGLTQDALAAAVGLQPAAISRMENGAIGTSLTTLGDLAEVLGVSPGALVGEHAPGAPSDEEERLLGVWRSLDAEHRATLRATMRWAAADQAQMAEVAARAAAEVQAAAVAAAMAPPTEGGPELARPVPAPPPRGGR